ncbi:MAG TPA: aminotransferase class V-fold PLP-dependent enzyme, partial [Thermoanaerobaculia bacterium]|nr:aminotransferase class V-fold PLP-dependent enzyme [Thermoanaerobaculia bacterium]
AFHNGFVYPIEELAEFCREKGILFVVDAIQGLGALPLDVSETPLDVLVADAHKWLLGPEACALFYVSENARERVPPLAAGWWNVKSAQSYLDYRLDFHLGGRRYEAGSLPTAQLAGLQSALGLLEEMGPETVRERILRTNESLKIGLLQRGWKILSPEPLRSGILSALPPGADERQAAKALEGKGIILSPREGALRFSPHASNDAQEVARVLEAVDAIAQNP